MKHIKEIMQSIVKELNDCLQTIEDVQISEFIQAIKEADHIFVSGTGRSLMMARAFAMRLMHLGFQVYIVGETNTPAISEKDMLIIVSGSGATKTLVSIAEKCKSLHAKLALITTNPTSAIAESADVIVQIKTDTSKSESNQQKSIQPGGNTFEQCVLLFCDALIITLFAEVDLKTQNKTLMKNHANLE